MPRSGLATDCIATSKRKLVRVKHIPETPSVTYQLEWILCGKKGCKRLHGPYWYAYWKRGKRTLTKYIGKKFKPLSLEPAEPESSNDSTSPSES